MDAAGEQLSGGMTIISGGIPVTVSGRIYSWNSNIEVIGSSASVEDLGAGDMRDPRYVWRTQRSVRTVVGFLAGNVAGVPLHAFTTDTNGDRDRLPATSALAKVLKRPNSTQTAFEFIEQMVTDRCLWDRYAALKIRTDNGVELLRLPPHRWKFERNDQDLPTAVLWSRKDGFVARYTLDVVLWTDAYSTGVDSTPMDSLFDLLTEQQESGTYRTSLWENGARMPGWIERPLEAPDWSTGPARTNFRTGWNDYAKDGVKAGRTPILEDGMMYHELLNGVTPEAAQQIEARKLSLAEVAAAYHVPPVFVGILDNATMANVDAFREQLYADVLGPEFQDLQQAVNARFVRDVAADDAEFAEFNVAEKLRLSFEKQSAVFQTATGGPFMTRNEARRRLNLPQLEGADELVVPLNVVIGGQASPTDSAPKRGATPP